MPSEVWGIDAGTIAFRRLLGESGGRDQARIDTLVALGRRTVFVVTWSGAEHLRTLTNAGGETALPLFTGPDVMRIAAARFGWVGPNGSISSKEIGAREALRYALDHGVGFVVVDLSSDYATEFTHEEVESLLGQHRGAEGVGAYAAVGTASEMIRRAVRQSNRPAGGAEGFRTSVPPPPRVPSELATPTAQAGPRMPERTVAQVSAPEMPDSLRRSVTGAPPPPTPSLSGPVAEMPTALRRSVTGAPPPPDAPPAREPSVAGMSSTAGSTAGPNATVLQAPGQFLTSGRAPAAAGAKAPSVAGTSAPSVAGSRAPSVSGAPAMQLPPLVTPFAVADRAPSERPPARTPSSHPAPRAQPEPPAASDAEVPSSAPPEASADEIHRPIEPLEERALERMAEALRRYPEVEWACELADRDGNPIIGLRIDPSFAGRTAEIGDAIQAAARELRTRVGVVLLVKPAQVRQGRALGRAFFPWRRKRG